MGAELDYSRREPPTVGPRSFLECSESRVGQTWTEENHTALLRHLAEVDELCIEIWKWLHSGANQR